MNCDGIDHFMYFHKMVVGVDGRWKEMGLSLYREMGSELGFMAGGKYRLKNLQMPYSDFL